MDTRSIHRLDYSLSAPEILYGWNCDGQGGHGPDCAGIVQVKLTINPEKLPELTLCLGQTGSLNSQ